MTLNAELAKWGEPPVLETEEALMAFVDELLERRARGEEVRPKDLLANSPELAAEGAALIQAVECIELFVTSVLEHASIQGNPFLAAGMETEEYEGPLSSATEGLPDPCPGGYRVRRFLGQGSFSRVWLADHLLFGIPVALKTLRFRVSGNAAVVGLTALKNEARILARLQHPNIARVYSLEQAGDEHYLVLQYVDGGSLQARLDKDGPLGWQLAARYIADAGEALLHVHAHGIVHRDIKLANILWDRQRDEAMLTDFGLAAWLTDRTEVAGTPQYMAPEAFSGRSSAAGDVYSLAASLFTLMTGHAPFPATTRKELLERINCGLPDPEPRLAGVPERLEKIIRAGLASAPEHRPTLATFVADLRGSLNRLLADTLVLPAAVTDRTGPVELRLAVLRWEGGNTYMPVAATHPEPRGMTRDLTKVPPSPERVGLRTGDRVRLEVSADRDGFLTVFNVGPTGQLNLLHPDPLGAATSAPVPANRPLHVTDIALTPPAGNERLFAVWSRAPLLLENAIALTRGDKDAVSPSYRATRNMERVRESVHQLPREDWHAVVLELDHGA
jgi:serine/threonine-protein kinase